MKVSGLSALPTNSNSFFHLCQSSRPILGVGGLNRRISQVGHPVGGLSVPLHFVVPVLKLLGLRGVQLVQDSCPAIESFGVIGIGLDSHFPVLDGLGRLSQVLKALPQEELCVRIVGMERNNFPE